MNICIISECNRPTSHLSEICLHHQTLSNRHTNNGRRRYNSNIKLWRERLKRETINAYGGECFCCKESNIKFLTIDHINNDGAEHKRRLGKGQQGGATVHSDLRRRGYPNGYQVACFNCNAGRHYNGGICPHQEVRL